jgi:hypothetical protein
MILNAALTSALGIVVRTNDAAKARATLYRVRKLLGDVELGQLQIRVSPDDSEHELWIIRKTEVGPTFDPNAA